jgi:predicted metal-dependent phosphoesterase TrpH
MRNTGDRGVKMKRFDLHMHTIFSPDSRNKPADLLHDAKRAGLNGIAITDHHTIEGALVTKELNKDKDFEVIIGEEVTTDKGDVIALFIEEEVRERDLLKVIADIKSQDGVVVIPHPFRPMQTFRYPLDSLVGKIDAIETINSRTPDSSNDAAARIAMQLPVAAVGSSDAHILLDIGKAYTVFDGELRDAIKARTTRAEGSKNLSVGVLSHLASGWFKVSGKIMPPKQELGRSLPGDSHGNPGPLSESHCSR